MLFRKSRTLCKKILYTRLAFSFIFNPLASHQATSYVRYIFFIPFQLLLTIQMNKLLILTWTKSFVPWRILPWLTRACSGSPAEKGAQGRLYQPSDISNSSGPIRHTTNTIALNTGLMGDRPDIQTYTYHVKSRISGSVPSLPDILLVICPDIRYPTGYQIQYPAFA